MRYYNLLRRVANWPDYFVDKLTGSRRETMTFRLRSGDRIEVPRDCLGEFKQIFFGDIYTRGLPRQGRGGVAVDIGANVGCFTLFAVSELGCDRVIAYEPDPTNFRQLARNVANNPHRNMVAREEAVGATVGEVEFFNDTGGAFTIGGTLNAARGAERSYSAIRVRCTTLDALMKEHGIDRCAFLKLDCEGAEYEIVEATPVEVLGRIDRIAMEVHAMPGRSADQIVDKLKSAGFSTQSDGPILWAWRA